MSTSGYYKWLEHNLEPEKDHDDYVIVKRVFDKGKGKYGWRTIQMKLKSEEKIIMNHKKIQRIKNKYNLFTKIRRINPYKKIMKKTLEHRFFDNVLNREFKQFVPYMILGTDITYLAFNHRIAYLSVIKDFASGEITGWNISLHINMSIGLDTIKDMTKNVPSLHGALIHSDQGFHYTNPQYINEIQKLGMIQSMSRKGCCIDNAPTESFFGHLKDDVDYRKCKTFEELKDMVSFYINYYNNRRQQWGLKKMTPVGYRNHLLLAGV